MKWILSSFALLLASAALTAQGTPDTLGGTSSAPSRANSAKANVIEVDQTVMLLKLEMYLSISGTETLQFFRYRHHSQKGSYVRDWTKNVKVTGTGAAWYSTGVITLPMIEGNHYLIGVSWAGSVTYHYNVGKSGQKFSFGSWYSGRTPTGVPPTITIGGVDVAQYYQRFWTIPLSAAVHNVGTPCATASSPRLVAASTAAPGGQFVLDVAEAAATTPAVFFLVPGKTLPQPLPLFGCQLWLNPANGVLLSLAAATDASGHVNMTLPIPNIPSLGGLDVSWQALLVEKAAVYLTNAVELRL